MDKALGTTELAATYAFMNKNSLVNTGLSQRSTAACCMKGIPDVSIVRPMCLTTSLNTIFIPLIGGKLVCRQRAAFQ